jgi:hypothetical protein
MSSLDGYSLTGIDTDPDTNVVMALNGLLANGLDAVAVLPVTFHGTGRKGYLIVSYDKTKDPRYES